MTITSTAERRATRPAQCVFLLSPAHCGGRRAQILMSERADFPLAERVRGAGAPIGEVFSFLSGLYFRGKLAYGQAFGRAHDRRGVLIITPGLGLTAPERMVTLDALRAIAAVGVSPDEPRFREPLERDCGALAATLAGDDVVVLLGSIATGKYVDVVERHFDGRLRFPATFVGRGDMSRGGLLLRCVRDRQALDLVPVRGTVRHGQRPPRLEPVRWSEGSRAARPGASRPGRRAAATGRPSP